MRLGITGGHGFLGWHTACRLRAVHGVEAVLLGRGDFADPDRLAARVATLDRVIHVAGVNRAESDAAVETGNVAIAEALAAAVTRRGAPVDIVFANSVQADQDNAYGRGKAAASQRLAAAVASSGGRYADVLLPNLFGEHGRPAYNSFVATFAHETAAGRRPVVTGDRLVPLLHAQDAAAVLLEALGTDATLRPSGEEHSVSEVAAELSRMHDLYAVRGEVPPLGSRFAVNLFNTYRAAAWPDMWPIHPQQHTDDRGNLFETVRSHGGTGQAFVSTTRPGRTRGDHYHLHKVERFLVVKGEAEISLRRLLHDEVVTFRLSGAQPAFVDMPTLWVHEVTNVGSEELVMMFWADQLLDPANPDQYAEKVRPS